MGCGRDVIDHKNSTLNGFNNSNATEHLTTKIPANEVIDEILNDLKRTHIIVNAEAGHGKTCAVKTLVQTIKERDPKTIIKVFDIIAVWWNNAPLPWRQKITVDNLQRVNFVNRNDCVYEIGDLPDEFRKLFIALIIGQDFDSRKKTMEKYGEDAVKNLPKIIYVFEEADIFFLSRFLNSSDPIAQKLVEFVKTGRNLGLRGLCIVTASVGELATKLRRRSKHLIGRVISDADVRAYNGMKKWKIEKGKIGLGDMVRETPRFYWTYYNGQVSEPFAIGDKVRTVPKDYVVKRSLEQTPLVESESLSLSQAIIAILIIVIIFLLLT